MAFSIAPLCVFSSSSSVPCWRILKLFPTWLLTTTSMMVTTFPKGRFCSVVHGKCEKLMGLIYVWLSFLRSILHDPKVFNNPMEYQPERYLKDGKLNPDMMDRDSVAFGYGRRWVYLPIFSYIYHKASSHWQDLSWKTLKRQLVVLNCILSSCSLWHQTTSWRPRECYRAQTRVH